MCESMTQTMKLADMIALLDRSGATVNEDADGDLVVDFGELARLATLQRVAHSLESIDSAGDSWNSAVAWALGTLAMHRDCHPAIAQALDRLEAAHEETVLANLEATDLLVDYGELDPPTGRPDAGGDTDAAEGRRVTKER